MDCKNLFCRLCAELHPDYNLLEISDDKAVNMNLTSKIMQCYNVKITNDDILPRHVCSNCCDKVINAFEFHELVHKSQEFLMKQVIQIKQENVECSNMSNSDMNINDFSDDFPPDTKMENDSDESNSEDEDEKPLVQRKPSHKDSVNYASGKRDYVSMADVERLVSEIRKIKWKCIECNLQVTSHKKFRNHYLNVHKKEPQYPCPDCPKIYNKYESYLSHKRVHDGRYICKICSKFCRDGSSLKRHMQTHSDFTPFSCTECHKSFKTSECLQRHQNVHLPNVIKKKKVKMFSCEHCPKTFTNKANLNIHKENHDDGEPSKNFVCDQCGRNFRQRANLNQHMSTHLNIFPYRCDKCPKAFKNIYSLNRHQKNHMDGQPYNCEICLRPFRHKRALKRHAHIHTNQLPYECEHCKKRFREKSYLKIHLRQHTGERPYSCIECNHHFTNDSNFIKHLKGRHGLGNVSVANQRQYPFINPIN